jgi:hypothetical protein
MKNISINNWCPGRSSKQIKEIQKKSKDVTATLTVYVAFLTSQTKLNYTTTGWMSHGRFQLRVPFDGRQSALLPAS